MTVRPWEDVFEALWGEDGVLTAPLPETPAGGFVERDALRERIILERAARHGEIVRDFVRRHGALRLRLLPVDEDVRVRAALRLRYARFVLEEATDARG